MPPSSFSSTPFFNTHDEGLEGWELRQFLPEDESLFSFEDESNPFEFLGLASPEVAVESPVAKSYRLVLARNRQKILSAQKFLVRKRVGLHQAYLHKIKLLEATIPALGPDEIMVVKTPQGLSARDATGREASITFGRIMTGFEWGIEYALDPATFSATERRAYLDRLYRHRVAILDREAELLELLVDAFKDESPSMAEAVKTYRERYRAAFDIETGAPRVSAFSGIAFGEKLVRSWLTELSYDFPGSHFSVRGSHPLEEMAYDLQIIVEQNTFGSEEKPKSALIAIAAMPERIQALGNVVAEPRGTAELRSDHEEMTHPAWLKKLADHRHDHEPVMALYLNTPELTSCYRSWNGEESLFAKATSGPYRFFDRAFWATVTGEALKPLLTPTELQAMVTKG